jgi:hypothetical protein
MRRSWRLRAGSIILAIDAFGLSAASVAMFAHAPSVTTTVGRLVTAGALANISLATIMILIALFPLRRGERWALAAYFLPFPVYGIPILLLDAANVASEHLLSTLAPQVTGLVVALIGGALVVSGMSPARRADS